jgi:hypothetical protein
MTIDEIRADLNKLEEKTLPDKDHVFILIPRSDIYDFYFQEFGKAPTMKEMDIMIGHLANLELLYSEREALCEAIYEAEEAE